MKRYKLAPAATQPGHVVVEVVDAVDGGLCLVVGGTRVAGCEPSLLPNNVRYRWNVGVGDWPSFARDDFVLFEVSEGDRWCGLAPLCLAWSEADVLLELRTRGYPLAEGDGHVAVFRGWPSDGEFTMAWGEVVFRFAARGRETVCGAHLESEGSGDPLGRDS